MSLWPDTVGEMITSGRFVFEVNTSEGGGFANRGGTGVECWGPVGLLTTGPPGGGGGKDGGGA